jgi:hypothetical protein
MDKITWQGGTVFETGGGEIFEFGGGKTFEVGDEVITNLNLGNPDEEPFEGTIEEMYDNVTHYYVKIRRDDTRRLWGIYLYKNKKIKEGTIFKHKSLSKSISKSAIMNIVNFFRNMTATPDEKLLKELGIEDPIGTPTSVGLELSANITYKANREEIIKIAKKMKAEKGIE